MLRSAAPLRLALRHSRPAARPLTRNAHFANTIHNVRPPLPRLHRNQRDMGLTIFAGPPQNFPFDHNNKAKFTAIYWGALTVSGVIVPAAAMFLQL